MAENQIHDQSSPIDGQVPSPHKEDMIACVMELEAALLPCLPARELQAIDRSPHPSHQMTLGECQRYYLTYGKRLKGSTVLHPLVVWSMRARGEEPLWDKLICRILHGLPFHLPSKSTTERKDVLLKIRMEESLTIDVERHAREFMEAAKKLQLYFIGLQQDENPSKAELLRKEISKMEEELKTKTELIKKHEKFIQGWRKELKEQLDKHVTELERV